MRVLERNFFSCICCCSFCHLVCAFSLLADSHLHQAKSSSKANIEGGKMYAKLSNKTNMTKWNPHKSISNTSSCPTRQVRIEFHTKRMKYRAAKRSSKIESLQFIIHTFLTYIEFFLYYFTFFSDILNFEYSREVFHFWRGKIWLFATRGSNRSDRPVKTHAERTWVGKNNSQQKTAVKQANTWMKLTS